MRKPRGNPDVTTPIEKALASFYERMPASIKRRHLALVRAAHDSCAHEGRLDIECGSGCSGSDLGFICLQLFLHFMMQMLSLPMHATHAFCCEKDELKQRFLKMQFSPKRMFGDVADLGRRMARDLISGHDAYIPWSMMFMAGFSCKSRTPCSSRAQANLNCLQRHDADAETSMTFEGIYAYIAKVLPATLLLENVVALLQKAGNAAISDGEWVIGRLMALGYYARYFKFDAEFYGSPAARIRIYFVAWLVTPGTALLNTSDLFKRLDAQFSFCDALLESCCIGPFAPDGFVTRCGWQAAAYENMTEHDQSRTQNWKKDVKWESEHIDAFRAHGLP